jgi:hypothetical protein
LVSRKGNDFNDQSLCVNCSTGSENNGLQRTK